MRSERDSVAHTISVQGELDLANADELERELVRVEGTDVLSIVLDLSALTFIDSTGLRPLIGAHARSRADANRLTLLRGPDLFNAFSSSRASLTSCCSPTDKVVGSWLCGPLATDDP